MGALLPKTKKKQTPEENETRRVTSKVL